ncbi:hypothetical protein JS532_00580 [Bifidobacterium callimiconis]|uniref:hypothetical protein n=1 Tax=Bifidobacterium callimiconis TaxID=2306973 RepID=UPI001BDBFF10|nr:hypothetical protein [Bifidobacterium callimiconis]MBT1176066.1 hypothetical protein [Bifidobacterium callimiconis]
MPAVTSYRQARTIVGRVSGMGVDGAESSGREDDTHWWVPLVHELFDDCCGAVDKKTGEAERLGTGVLMSVVEPVKH